jgi:hypothetical protein
MTETKLNQNINLMSLPGYNIIRNDRTEDGGGVAIVLKSHIKFNLIKLNLPGSTISKIETLTIKVQIGWMNDNGMKINLDKTQVIVLGSSYNVEKVGEISLKIGGVEVRSQNVIKSLGLIIDSKLTWCEHINTISKRFHYMSKTLYPLKPVLSSSNYIKIVHACLISLFNYMTVIWGTADAKYLKIIEKNIRKLARNVFSMKKSDPIRVKIFKELKWFFPKDIYNYQSLSFVYKCIHHNIPYFKHSFPVNSELHAYSTRLKNDIHQSFCPKNKIGEKSIFFKPIIAWNNLPNEISLCMHSNTFKKLLKNHILNSNLYL